MRQITETVLAGQWKLISVNCISSGDFYSCTFEGEGAHIFDIDEIQYICMKYGVRVPAPELKPGTKMCGDDAEDYNVAGEYVNRLAAETIDPFVEDLIDSITGKTTFSDQ
jgi:hypothetical protein